jgi:cytochrome d ubiquinol oxidase subunit I
VDADAGKGYHIVTHNGVARAEITDFWQLVFNPSSMERLFHTVCGAWQTGAFLVVSVSAWYLLKRRNMEFARASLKVGLSVALVASLLQAVSGHVSAQGVAKNQPAKLAAFEGLYQYDIQRAAHAPRLGGREKRKGVWPPGAGNVEFSGAQ